MVIFFSVLDYFTEQRSVFSEKYLISEAIDTDTDDVIFLILVYVEYGISPGCHMAVVAVAVALASTDGPSRLFCAEKRF